jgi:uncharacterized phage protein gp47/JayE
MCGPRRKHVPFDRPTLSELITRVRADFRGRLGIGGSLLRRAMANVLAPVWAGAVHELHGHLKWASEQLLADKSEREYMLREAAMYGITPIPATFATGAVTATGTNGSVIAEDTFLVRDDGARYRVTADATISSGTATVSIEAEDAGALGNLEDGETLAPESPIAGVSSTMTVTVDGIDGGFDEESTEGTRARLILRKREPPQGGGDQDYQAWALAVAGVTRVWVYRHEDGLGTVTVRFVMDGEVDIFPDAGAVSDVQNALDSQRPITAEVTAAAPDSLELDFTIEIVPDTVAVRDAVEAELTDLLFRDAEPGDGAGRGTIKLSRILVAIGVADGVEDFTLTVPSADVVPAVGELAVMGTITWV